MVVPEMPACSAIRGKEWLCGAAVMSKCLGIARSCGEPDGGIGSLGCYTIYATDLPSRLIFPIDFKYLQTRKSVHASGTIFMCDYKGLEVEVNRPDPA
jgi:hypothetical protein